MRLLRTQVGIIGAGPSGLLLSHLLHLHGIESIVVESRSKEYVEKRVRAGQLQQSTVDLLRGAGLGARLDREGLIHEGFELRFNDRSHRMPFTELTGRTVRIYGQQEVVKDLIKARIAAGGQLYFAVDDVAIFDVCRDSPVMRCTLEGEAVQIACDFIAGCDGFHGMARKSVPANALSAYEKVYQFAWLGILAAAPPTTKELVFSVHDRGFALHSIRSLQVSRLYLQVANGECLTNWPDERIWKELHARLSLDSSPQLIEGPVLEKSIVTLRSFVVEPMQHGRLFLVGDAAHIFPPTAAKGLNLAVTDTALLAEAFASWYSNKTREPLDEYSANALRRAWRAQEFSAWMTSLLHRFPDDAQFDTKLQRSQLEHLISSSSAATNFAENYVGVSLS
ncbi:MAG: 4-hydroxybenzoate 3-monooxygenase [Pseudonocardiaceae bacterium]